LSRRVLPASRHMAFPETVEDEATGVAPEDPPCRIGSSAAATVAMAPSTAPGYSLPTFKPALFAPAFNLPMLFSLPRTRGHSLSSSGARMSPKCERGEYPRSPQRAAPSQQVASQGPRPQARDGQIF
jgi:hypothetical protein